MARIGRLRKEMDQIMNDPPPGISILLEDRENIATMKAFIHGPDDTPYKDGVFELVLDIPNRYPFEPPRVRFATPIYHPNIDHEGRICLDTLKSQPQGTWSPSVNISTLLLSIRLLMAQPNADDGLMIDITSEYQSNRSLWFQKALDMTSLHARKYSSESLPPVPIDAGQMLATRDVNTDFGNSKMKRKLDDILS